MLTSHDGGRTLVPFSGSLGRAPGALAAYIAVKHMGYWADAFVSEGHALQPAVESALDAILASAGPGVMGSVLHAKAIEALNSHALHPALSGSVGNRIGYSPDEGGRLTQDSADMLKIGDTYSLRVGAHDAGGGAFASAMVAITSKGYDLVHRSTAPKKS
jgi:Xaa-Pro aminopeptidase